jgi:hypothetical protein
MTINIHFTLLLETSAGLTYIICKCMHRCRWRPPDAPRNRSHAWGHVDGNSLWRRRPRPHEVDVCKILPKSCLSSSQYLRCPPFLGYKLSYEILPCLPHAALLATHLLQGLVSHSGHATCFGLVVVLLASRGCNFLARFPWADNPPCLKTCFTPSTASLLDSPCADNPPCFFFEMGYPQPLHQTDAYGFLLLIYSVFKFEIQGGSCIT